MIQTEYFQFRYKNFRRPSGRRYFKITGTEDQIIDYVKGKETKKTHLQWLYNASEAIKKIAESIDLTDQYVKPKQLEFEIAD